MILNVYADPSQGITLSLVGDTFAQAIPSFYDTYAQEMEELFSTYGDGIECVVVTGNMAYALKIAQEIQERYPETRTVFA